MILRTLALAAVATFLLVPPVAHAANVTCTYSATDHKVKVTFTGPGYYTMSRDSRSRIRVAGIWCGDAATVYNTDQINVFAGDGNQGISVNMKANGGFQPGFTDEAGSSDEVEISISLGGGDNDVVSIDGEAASDHFVAGRSSGSIALLGRVNVNADEATGVDGDITLILGIEQLSLYGGGGGDTLSGEGGFGTGESYNAHMYMLGVDGADILTGGGGADTMYGGDGDDTLKGGPGADFLNTQDGVQGNDTAQGGTGADACITDPGDAKTSC